MHVLKGMRRSTPSGRRVRLPITPEILEAIQMRWSVRPVSFDRIMLWAAALFCLHWVGKFTFPSLASFDESVMLSVGDVAVDSHSEPSYILVWLKRSRMIHLLKESPCTLDSPTRSCVRSQQCWLTWRFAFQLQAHSRMAECCLGSGWWLSSQLHCRRLGLTSHYSRVTASILEQPLQWLRLGWAIP